MLFNLSNGLLPSLNRVFDDDPKKKFMHRFYRGQLKLSDLATIRYKTIRTKKVKDVALMQINLLMSLIIGKTKIHNKNYDYPKSQSRSWSIVAKGDTYDIPQFSIVCAKFTDIITITLQNDDASIFIYIINKLDEISELDDNPKKLHFMKIIADINKDNLRNKHSSYNDPEGLLLIMYLNPKIIDTYFDYLKSNPKVNPFRIHSVVATYFISYITDDMINPITKLLQMKHYNILYIMRNIYIKMNKGSDFKKILIHSIIRLLFGEEVGSSIFSVSVLKEHACYATACVIGKHFNNLLSNDAEMSYSDFVDAFESHFGQYDVETFNLIKNAMSNQLLYMGSLSFPEKQKNHELLIKLNVLVNNLQCKVNDNISEQEKLKIRVDQYGKCKLYFKYNVATTLDTFNQRLTKLINQYDKYLNDF